jgi:DNA-binding transcriptional ArsR family regulator
VQEDCRKLARIFNALSNPNRLEIYSAILRNESANYEVGNWCMISEVCQSLKIGSPTISHHVKELVDAGLILAERQGKFLVCRINPETRELVRTLFE